VLTEGYDEPSADCIVIARPTRSRPLYVQMVGRGLRPFPDKDDLLVLDVVGATQRHDLVTACTLFGVPSLEDGLREALDDQRQAQAGQRHVVEVDGRLVTESVDLLHRAGLDRREFSWVTAGPGRYVLGIQDAQIFLVQSGELWDVVLRPRHGEAEIIRAGTPLEWSTGIAEDLVRKLGATHLARRTARWRSEPASDKQREVLQRCRLPVDDLTKGEAADLLTAHFARQARV